MEQTAFDFLQRLLETPSPSGYEQAIQRVVREYVHDFADEVTTDIHGNVIVGKNPGTARRVMLAGHCDQIGMLISYVDENGYLYAQTIGGWDPQQLIGQQMTIWTESGPLAAVIARKPIHLLNEQERKQVVKLEELWLDIGATSREDASARVRIGDPVTLALGFRRLQNNRACAPGMDNKTGLWVVIEALRRASSRSLSCSVFAVSTVQEEIGLRGARTSAHSIDPHIGIAVDVTHATDCPTIDMRQQGEVKLGSGPVVFRGPNMNPRITDKLLGICREKNIPCQPSAIGRATPNDANTIQVNRGGVATGLVSIPNRYMHSAVETISLDDIDHAADLLAEFVCQLELDEEFIP